MSGHKRRPPSGRAAPTQKRAPQVHQKRPPSGTALELLQRHGLSIADDLGAYIIERFDEVEAQRPHWRAALRALDEIQEVRHTAWAARDERDLVKLGGIVDALRTRLQRIRVPAVADPAVGAAIQESIDTACSHLENIRVEAGRGRVFWENWWPSPPVPSTIGAALLTAEEELSDVLHYYWRSRSDPPEVGPRVLARVLTNYGNFRPGETIAVGVNELARVPHALEPADGETAAELATWKARSPRHTRTREGAPRNGRRRGPNRDVSLLQALLCAEHLTREITDERVTRPRLDCTPAQLPAVVAALLHVARRDRFRGGWPSVLKRVREEYRRRIVDERKIMESGYPRRAVSRRT